MGRSLRALAWFVGSRLLQLIPVLLGVLAITFFFTHLMVKDPCAAWTHGRPQVIKACIAYFGLNQPLPTQFYKYLATLAHGNWGNDPLAGPVYPLIAAAVPETLELVLAALLIMVAAGIPLGVLAATNRGRWIDHAVRVFYLSGWAMPTYLIGILFVVYLGPGIDLPTGGDFTNTPTFAQPTHFSVVDAALTGNANYVVDAIAHLIMPALALAFLNMGIVTRMTRASMLEVLPLDFIKTARMKGLTDGPVHYRHALRNSLISTVTVLGFTASGMLSSTVVIEELFRWPGIGDYAYSAIVGFNFAGTLGTVIVFAIAVVFANLAADLAYGFLDPRVEWA